MFSIFFNSQKQNYATTLNSTKQPQRIALPGAPYRIYLLGNPREKPILFWVDGISGWLRYGCFRYIQRLFRNEFALVHLQPKAWSADRFQQNILPQETRFLISTSEWLARHIRQPEILLVGHDWGSIPALLAAQQRPDLYSAYIGISQRVHSIENENIAYENLLASFEAHGSRSGARKLQRMGPPPYAESLAYNYLWKQNDKLSRQELALHVRPPACLWYHAAMRRLAIEPFLFRKSSSRLLAELGAVNLKESIRSVNVPVYLLLGRYDRIVAPGLAEAYFNQLYAPHKTLIWFEKSGHHLLLQEAQKSKTVLQKVLQQNDHTPL